MILNIRRFWSYILIAVLLAIIAYMYFNRQTCPVQKQAVTTQEGYELYTNDTNNNNNNNNNNNTNINNGNSNGPIDNTKGELILYYANWCGFSKQFLPIWKEYKEGHASATEGLVVREVLCEGGDEKTCFEKGVEGYPTIILYPKNDTEVVFQGNRTVGDLEEFVNKNL